MRWKGRRKSKNVEDRRGESVPRGSNRGLGVAGGLGIGKLLFSLFARGSGKTKLLLILGLVVAMFVFKFNPLSLISGGPATMGSNSGQSEQTTPRKPAPNDEYAAFLKTILGMNEEHWAKLLPKYGIRYEPAAMVIYDTATRMDDGSVADARMGPFYLPAEKRIYLDPTFFEEMETKFGIKGEFARAYVVSHEFGHHIQNLMGRTTALHSKHGKISKIEYNRESVRLELHADFLAGVYAHHDDKNFDSLDRADIQSAMACAKAIGDDILQKRAGREVNTDHFTHGSSEQRARWFMKGYTTGDLKVGEQIYTMDYERL